VKNGDIKGLDGHLQKTLAYSKDVLDKLEDSTDRVSHVLIPELNGLLLVKFAYALARDIELEIDIADPVRSIPINLIDLCRIVGIIIDNAIEELTSKDYEHKVLRFGILINRSETLIVCTNSCQTLPDVEQIFEKCYSTKDGNEGLGLYNLRKICKKSTNTIASVHYENNEFTMLMTIREV